MATGSQGELAPSSGRIKISTSKMKIKNRSRKMMRPSCARADRSLAILSFVAAREAVLSDIGRYAC